MAKRSAGILLYRRREDGVEVLLVHPGGPFWAKRDEGAWSIPKGEIADVEEALAAARREFEEETGFRLRPGSEALALGSFRQSSAKTVEVWAIEGDADPRRLVSNTFRMEWPPRSGRYREIPEVDRAAWFALPEAARRLVKGQTPVIEALRAHLRAPSAHSRPKAAGR
jgi:predicted NUDIX family NTP pyrophosphohydrolase